MQNTKMKELLISNTNTNTIWSVHTCAFVRMTRVGVPSLTPLLALVSILGPGVSGVEHCSDVGCVVCDGTGTYTDSIRELGVRGQRSYIALMWAVWSVIGQEPGHV